MQAICLSRFDSARKQFFGVFLNARVRFLPSLLRCFSVALLVTQGATCIFAATVSCPVQGSHYISPAEQAFLEHDYETAAKLYRDQLIQKPNDAEIVYGLTRVLLHQQKVSEAEEVVRKAIAASPDAALVLTAVGEVQYRAGTPWLAAETAKQAQQKDPCIAQSRLLNARILELNSLYGSAASEVATAHMLDPHDPAIRLMWINSLPAQQRITELHAYLDSKTGDDPEELASLHRYLDYLEKQAKEPHKSCHIVSNTQSTDIPFITLMRDASHVRAFGLEVKLNDHAARLQIDTGAGGLMVSRSVAERAGLQQFSRQEVEGVGDKGTKASYTAYADHIQIGGLEFQDCQIEVLDARNVVDSDGLIGMDVFSQFLVTLDYPMRKLTLGPLPRRPDETTPAARSLNTSSPGDSGSGAAASGNAAGAAESPKPGANSSHLPHNRYIAPEMKDWELVYRVHHHLMMPTLLNDKVTKLFILDTGAFSTTIQPDVAREVTKVHRNENLRVNGISGDVAKVYTADDIDFKLGHVEQKSRDVVAFEMPRISRNTGLEVAGLIGITTLGQMTVKIDYRDGLVKFDYDPKRGYKYPGMN